MTMTSLTRTGHIRRAARLVALAAIGLIASSCTDDTASPTPATGIRSEGSPVVTVTEASSTTVSYADDVLSVGGITLDQFPGYEKADGLEEPTGWPVKTDVGAPRAALTITSIKKPLSAPAVSAVILFQNELATEQHEQGMRDAEREVGLVDAPAVVESSVKGPSRECHYRVKAGPIDGAADNGVGLAATVIAAGTRWPSAAVFIRTGGPDTTEMERLAKEVAEALCQI